MELHLQLQLYFPTPSPQPNSPLLIHSDGCLYGKLEHVLAVLSMHQTYASLRGERACLESQWWIMPRGRGAKRGLQPPALRHRKSHALSLLKKNASQPFEMQGLPRLSGRELHILNWSAILKSQATEEVLY